MTRVPTPIPKAAAGVVRRIFAGPLGRILWKLFALVAGAFLILWLVSASGYFAAAVAGIVLSVVLSSTIRSILRDIWNARFLTIKL
jgi:hypothetical protein